MNPAHELPRDADSPHRSLGKTISHISRDIQWMIRHELDVYGVGSASITSCTLYTTTRGSPRAG